MSRFHSWPAPSGWRLLKPGMKKPLPGLAEWGELELVLRVRRRFWRFILMGDEDATADGVAEALKWIIFVFAEQFVFGRRHITLYVVLEGICLVPYNHPK